MDQFDPWSTLGAIKNKRAQIREIVWTYIVVYNRFSQVLDLNP